MRLHRGRSVEALACADRWSADTVDAVAALPWAAAVTGGQARRWLAALYDLGWRPPAREPAGTATWERLDVDISARACPIDGRRWR